MKKMEETFLTVNSVKSQVLSWGHKAGEEFDKSIKEIVLVIPGCPGISKYYATYIKSIYTYLEKQMPVYIISHCGISDPEDIELNIPPLKGNEHLFNIDGQIKHKVEFIKQFIPEHIKIHLIGHSFGSYCITQLLKNPEINKRIHQAYLLFPAIDHVGETPNGIVAKKIKFLFPVAEWISKIFYYFPQAVRLFFVSIYCYFMSLPKTQIVPHLLNCKPAVVNKGLALLTEILNVGELEIETLNENVDKLKFYYGTEKNDGWGNDKHMNRLLEKVPKANAEMDTYDIWHCFQLRSGLEMGQITADWIKENRPKF